MTDKQDKKLHGTYAEFDAVDPLLAACTRVREAGYTKTDAFTPFPVHGIEKALGIKPTALPWISLICGLTGTTIALTMQIWMNTINYPYIISGKPMLSLPAFIPVSFELTILLASFGAFFGMFALNRLPKFSNPLFTAPRFDRATDDKFFLYIDAKDARFDHAGVKRLLAELGGEHVQDVYEDDSRQSIPRPLLLLFGGLIFLSLIPMLVALRMRVTDSENTRYHVFLDMDFSPAKGPQMTSTLFADDRWQRPDVPGTVAIGQLSEAPDFYTGIDMEQLAKLDAPRATRLVRSLLYPDDATAPADAAPAVEPATETEPVAADATDQPAGEPEPAAEPANVTAGEAVPAAAADNTPWLTENPLPLTAEALQRGQTQFNIYCATCHGQDGRGNGLVNRRAQKILASTWVQPSSLHEETLYQDVYPDGKMFNTITHGIRKMGGYGSQIKVKDRWALVGYVRALQLSQNASLDDFAADSRATIATQQTETRERLEREAAEAEQQRLERAAQDAAAEAAAN